MPSLIRPQAEFLALPHRFRAYVAGFGAGKTWAGCAEQCEMAWTHPGLVNGYFAPTYVQIRDIFYPTMEECAFDWGLTALIKPANKEVELYAGREWRGTIICRSMDNPNAIVGLKIARALIDEIDTMPQEKALWAFRKIMARLRLQFDGLNGASVTTTPEGFRFTWNQWVKQVRDDPSLAVDYGMVRASTYDNEANLPAGYINSMMVSFPGSVREAYINGHFVNLTQGTVYVQFDRDLNNSTETIRPGEPLEIGLDFNVGKMAAVVHVTREGNPHAVAELMGGYDTPDMIDKINARFGGHAIRVYPDASGGSRKTENASTTDIQLLKDAGFSVSAPAKNPAVRDRVNAMNAMFCNAKGERRYFVNVKACPTFAEALEQQAYTDRGEPDKRHDQDHPNDAAGYFIHRRYPLTRPVTKLNIGVAM